MRAASVTPAHVRRALELFNARAYPEGCGKPPVFPASLFEHAATLEQVLGPPFVKEDDGGHGARRITLRAGNQRYFFMKLVVTEYLVEDELYFAVDTHDNLPLSPHAPDYAQWLEVKRHNRALKESIEGDWRAAGLPTFAELRLVCESLAQVEREERKNLRVLVVDDERDIALAVAALLGGRGYDAEVAFSGAQTMERLVREPKLDLALLDFELPDLDGVQLCELIRGDPELARVAVVMATAARIELARLGRVSGFLRKPYPRRVLFALLRQLLVSSAPST